ncbi:hypothetical protein KF840_23495 [bacterium]|nr:hypothetical protein [bacterium]
MLLDIDRNVALNLAGGDLGQLAVATAYELTAMGLPPAGIERLWTLFEFARRYSEREFPVGEPFRCSADIYGHFRERLATERVEFFYAVLLDNKHRKLRDVLLSKGSLTASIVHPRDAYLPVIRYSAAAVIFVHNHPSGDPTPSREDLDITRRLREVGELIGVRVLDHIVIGQGRYVSFVDDGYWDGALPPSLASSGKVSEPAGAAEALHTPPADPARRPKSAVFPKT